jgi:DNA-binding NarL/FixJ family response regulator
MSQARPTVLLADDHPGILHKLSRLLLFDFEVVGAVGDGAAAVEAVARLNPDIVVMDISMPGMGGVRATREIQRMGVDSKVVVLSGYDDLTFVACAFEAGGRGYVLKSRMNTDLILAIQEVLAGRTFRSDCEIPSDSRPARQLA